MSNVSSSSLALTLVALIMVGCCTSERQTSQSRHLSDVIQQELLDNSHGADRFGVFSGLETQWVSPAEMKRVEPLYDATWDSCILTFADDSKVLVVKRKAHAADAETVASILLPLEGKSVSMLVRSATSIGTNGVEVLLFSSLLEVTTDVLGN